MRRLWTVLCICSVVLPLFAQPDVRQIVRRRQAMQERERQAMIRWMENAPTTTREMDDYDVRYYKINIAVDFDNEYVSAYAEVRFEVVTTSMDTLHLHFADILDLEAATVQGQMQSCHHSDGIVTVSLGNTYTYGDVVTARLYYSGYPDQDRLEDGLKFAQHSGTPIAFTMVSPRGARKWWPCKDTPADKPDSLDIWVTYPEQYTSASNGILVESVNNGDGTVTDKWHESYPIATYLTSFAITNYEVDNLTWSYDGQTMPVTNYYYPEQAAASTEQYARIIEMLGFYSDIYGTYPFLSEKYGHATCTSLGAVAMEHQTCTSFDASYVNPNDYANTYTMAHELGHSWAGDCLSLSSWSEVWLKEGFAVYSEALWAEHTFGEDALFDYMDEEDTGSALDDCLYRDPDGAASHIFDSVVYNKGGWVVHMLRFVMGDPVFFEFLQAYFGNPELRYGNTDMQTLEDVAEAAYGNQLDWFFDEWFYQEGRPYYDYAVYWPVNLTHSIVAIESKSNFDESFSMFIPYEYDGNDGRMFVQPGLQHITIPYGVWDSHNFFMDPDGWVLDGGFNMKTPVLHQVPSRDGTVRLVWDPWFDEDFDGFEIYIAAGTFYTNIDFVPAGQNSYVHEGLVPGQTYRYCIEPLYGNRVYHGPWSNSVEAVPVEYSFDQGVLIVDNSGDYTVPGFPTDEQMDAFYASVTAPLEPVMWDVATQGEPPLSELARYSTVIWHADDIQQGEFASGYYNLENYLMAGGNLLISQCRKLSQMDTDVLRDYFGVAGCELCYTAEFTGATGDGWPHMAVDPEKIPLPNWGDNLAQVYSMEPATGAEVLYRFDAVGAQPPWQDAPCAVLADNMLLLGFPLYYLQEDDVAQFMTVAMQRFGELAADSDAAPAPALSLQAWPNPFNPSTTLSYNLPQPATVRLHVYDVRGRRVHQEHLGPQSAGQHSVSWQPCGLASGVYLVRLQAGAHSAIRRVVLLK